LNFIQASSADPILLQSYYTVAARLGDADAQQDLGFCLANGRGCKKDRKEAAKWYREAVSTVGSALWSILILVRQVAQGASDVGMAWIYKEKFQ
jgi:TPR repeat protein